MPYTSSKSIACFLPRKRRTPHAPSVPKKEAHPMSKPLGRHAASLPVKDGAPDKTVYDKFAAGSLRRRVWDAIVAAKCPWCNGDDLRVACTKPHQGRTISNAKTSSLSRSLKRTDQHSKRNSAALSYLRILTLLTPVCYGGPAPRDGSFSTQVRTYRSRDVTCCWDCIFSSLPLPLSTLGGRSDSPGGWLL